jgi:hypothetical protein
MSKPKVLAVGAAIIAAALIASVSWALSEKDVFELQCNLAGKSGRGHYAFHLEVPKYFGRPRLVMVGRLTLDLKVEHLDNTKIYATLDHLHQKLGGLPDNADLMSFDFNRITGDVEIDYLHQPTEAELKEEKNGPLAWGALLVLSDFSQMGTCVKAKPAF